jgi:NDP-sugar pyrophosphorylase family protein
VSRPAAVASSSLLRATTPAWTAGRALLPGDGADVRSSVLLPGCVVEPGAKVERSVVLPGARVRAGVRLSGAVAAAGEDVNAPRVGPADLEPA